ncbi:membrane lipoprotein lipid attachment site-containing protein [Cetobacterium ceti]
MKKIIFFISLLIAFSGCSAIMHSIGESDINRGINIYQSRGLTTEGINYLASGLSNAPDSIIGIESFKRQYLELENQSENILRNKIYSERDINALKLYLLASEKYSILSGKIPQLTFNKEKYFSLKNKINTAFENYVLKDNLTNLNRKQKINKIFYYKSLLKYNQNYIIREKITKLEQEISINIVLTSSFRYRYNSSNFDIQNILISVADKYTNRDLGNYVYFRGYNSYNKYWSNNSYLVDMEFYNFETPILEISERKEGNGEKIIISQRKKLILSGEYRVIDSKTYGVVEIKPFRIEENYNIEMSKTQNTINFSNENDVIRKILEKKFTNIILYRLRDFRNF